MKLSRVLDAVAETYRRPETVSNPTPRPEWSETVPNPTPRPAQGEEGYEEWTATIPNPAPKPAGYDEWTPTVPNPQTKAAFLKAQVIKFLKEVVIAHEADLAAVAARKDAVEQAEADITLT
ncbi:MAG: hypothetical protein H7831_08400 [Magnetococcus sp. WYHC-3]